jgi:FixJ family two-component response regulator
MKSKTQSDTPAVGIVDIAVLDDDKDFLQYMEDFLTDEGTYDVSTYTYPDDLLASSRPEIVLLDMKMGPFSGAIELERIQQKWPDVCVVIVTGYPSLKDMRTTFKRQVFDYLAKPFSLVQLRQTLANAIQTHGLGKTPQKRLHENLGRQVKLLRVEKDWSLKDLASHSGISVSQLSSIERGTHMPSIDSLLQLCEALDTKPSELLASIDF